MPKFRVTGLDRSTSANRTITVDADTKADAEIQGAVLGLAVSAVAFDKAGTVEELRAPLAGLAQDAGALGYKTPASLELSQTQREMRRLKPWIKGVSAALIVLLALNLLGCAALLVDRRRDVGRLELAFLLGMAVSQAFLWTIGVVLLRVVGVIGLAVADASSQSPHPAAGRTTTAVP